jgi:6-phosphogluconolactonase
MKIKQLRGDKTMGKQNKYLSRRFNATFVILLFSMVFVFPGCGGGGGGGSSSSGSTHTVTYNGNGNTGGSVPVDSNTYQQGNTATVIGNTGSLVKTGHSFAGWNTLANGSGTTYTQGQTITAGTANITLYAQWTASTGQGYAYVANQYDNTISQYTIGADGTLTPMSPATVATGETPESITVDPSGKYVYVPNAKPAPAGRIYQYSIGADGALSPMSIPWVTAGTYPESVAVDPSGKYAYVANNLSNDISEFTIGTDGEITLLGTVMSGTGYPNAPSSVVVDPSGKYAYVANTDGRSVSQYTISATGVLTPMTPATVATSGTNGNAWHMTIHPSGGYLYVAGYFDNVVFQYAVGTNGALTPMATVATGSHPASIVVDPSGKYAYVANAVGSISQYTIVSGAFTPMTPATVGTSQATWVTIDASGKYLYSTSGTTVSQYTIGTNGALTPMTPATVPSGSGSISIVTVNK